MRIHLRTRPDDAPRTSLVVTGPDGKTVLLIDGTHYLVHDRRLRELEVLSATEHERGALKAQGYRIHRL